jgi:hypothetical protein
MGNTPHVSVARMNPESPDIASLRPADDERGVQGDARHLRGSS